MDGLCFYCFLKLYVHSLREKSAQTYVGSVARILLKLQNLSTYEEII